MGQRGVLWALAEFAFIPYVLPQLSCTGLGSVYNGSSCVARGYYFADSRSGA